MEELWSGRSQLQEFAPGVFITNFFGAKKRKNLEEAQVKAVVVCAHELPCVFENDGIEYLKLHLADNATEKDMEAMKKALKEAITFIQERRERGENVLLHCAGGASRSGSVAIYYKMVSEKMGFVEALERVRGVRPIVAPNPGYKEVLTQLEEIYS